ncbi:hypothetical protein CWE08_08890 [Aliidiomarina iranensis]|uniref:DUF3047 domain-containing protein n=1 Tax=Aliidiomarina iranensis TaxID=1434071 RepID=A0A432VUD1_9GAMM|nr:DUF3047 domain-containing protein [Aliidiomarina iranensis]RUO20019.1 hypothetical protein CWE08_08890 [Aliidiomarina iranensis]
MRNAYSFRRLPLAHCFTPLKMGLLPISLLGVSLFFLGLGLTNTASATMINPSAGPSTEPSADPSTGPNAAPSTEPSTGPGTDWKAENMIDWEAHSFVGSTDYQLVAATENSEESKSYILASCEDGQASGMFYREEIDLTKTPMLSWEWRVNEFPQVGNEREKSGDDFAARIYVVREHSILRWRTRALNYVWSQQSEIGTNWSNPFATQAHMIAMGYGEAGSNQWQTETRDLQADFESFHGQAPDMINAIAIMTDCDNSNSSASASYRRIRLHAREEN